MATAPVRVLVVDDYASWRRHLCSVLGTQPKFQVIAEVMDGEQAVQQAQELRPDLILLDIGLSSLNGIEAARRIRKLSPHSKILFISQEMSADIVQAALGTGAAGYIVKMDAMSELSIALEAILRGEKYVSTRLRDRISTKVSAAGAHQNVSIGTFLTAGSSLRSAREPGHVVNFYTDDAILLDGLSSLIGDSLAAGESAVAVMTTLHRIGLEQRLVAQRIDINEAIKNGRLAIYDADQALSLFMDAFGPSRERFHLQFGSIVRMAQAAAVAKTGPVVVFGEMVAVLWARKQYDAAIQLEALWNELALTCSFYLCCAYPISGFEETLPGESFAAICAQHSDVVSRF